MNYRSTQRFVVTALLGLSFGAGLVAKERAIYPDPGLATADIRHALQAASKTTKRIVLDFGGNWCGDCKALDKIFHEEPNSSILKHNFILVDVNIGHFDKNDDIAKRYEVPLKKGVPALAVLASDGRLLFSQKKGEFESMRTMDPASVTEFLKRWKS